jgi:hypothetical protein
VRPCFAGQDPNFRFITLKEPLKKDMIAFLDHLHNGSTAEAARPARQARVQVIASPAPREAHQLFELIVDLDEQSVVKLENLKGKHSYIDSSYMGDVEKACLADERVQAEIQTLRLPPEAVVCVEAWAYATDGMNEMTERITMVSTLSSNLDIYMYMPILTTSLSVGSICVLQAIQMPIITHIRWTFALKSMRNYVLSKFIGFRQAQLKEFTTKLGHMTAARFIRLQTVSITQVYDQGTDRPQSLTRLYNQRVHHFKLMETPYLGRNGVCMLVSTTVRVSRYMTFVMTDAASFIGCLWQRCLFLMEIRGRRTSGKRRLILGMMVRASMPIISSLDATVWGRLNTLTGGIIHGLANRSRCQT